MTNTLPTDANNAVYEGIRNAANQTFVAKAAGTVSTDAGGVASAPQLIQVIDPAGVNQLAISANGSIALPVGAAQETGHLANVDTNTAHLAAKPGYVTLTAPSTTNTAADTTLTFASQVNHWLLQNNSSVNVTFELDATATAGSILLAPNSTYLSDVPLTSLHLYTATSQSLNGSAAGNIVVRGWL